MHRLSYPSSPNSSVILNYMIPFFPRQISNRALIVYLSALALVSLVYFDYAMKVGYYVLGVVWVSAFFYLTANWSQRWQTSSNKDYLKSLILVAISLRLVWVVISYFYYIRTTGIPFEFATADALAYHEEARWLASENWSKTWEYYFGTNSVGISDVGYPLYLSILYRIFGPIIILPRLLKAFISTWTCVMVYKLSTRTFGEETGRLAGAMIALMPNLVIYCGYHLKETEMLFLEVAFLERMDYMIRSHHASFWDIVLASVLALSLFFFRTVLGAAAIFSFATVVLISNVSSMRRGWKRTALFAYGILGIVVASGGSFMTELEGLWEGRENNVTNKRYEQTVRGNLWAQYATGVVMAPMAFILPFSTMIEVDEQYAQNTKHSGNFIRNFMGFFALIALYEAIRRKKWRDFSLIGSFVIAYLGVISLTGFSNSERFLLPGLPCLIMMWSYGVSTLRKETYRFMTPWCFLVIAMEFAWAFFKLGSRGLL